MNPALIAALRSFAPYAIAAAIGFAAAWWLQGLRVTAAENGRDAVTNDFAAYKTEQKRLLAEAEAKANQQREDAANAWAKNLESVLADKGAFERCVAAGRCAAVVRVLPGAGCTATPAVPAAKPVDGSSAGPIPAASGTAALTEADDPNPGLTADCQRAVLQINALQADIERQPRWAQ